MHLVAPSLLAADFLHLGAACQIVNESDADWFHLDIMDGRFVPNISYGMSIVEQIHSVAKKPCDVHLMIEEPERYVPEFKKVGADHITVHWEACRHLHRNVQQIKSLGMKAGVAINPATPVDFLQAILPELDIVLVMSVNPGFGGQTFISHTFQKVRKLRKMIHDLGAHTHVMVDGGISVDNASAIVAAGADVLVAGSTVFHAPDSIRAIGQLKNA